MNNYLQKPECDLILIGNGAYNEYASLFIKGIKFPLQYYEFYSTNPINSIKLLIDYFEFKSSEFEVKRYYQYLHFLNKKYTIFYKGEIFIEIYDIETNCIGFKHINRIKVINYHGLLEYLYTQYTIKGLIEKNKEKQIEYTYLIMAMQTMFTKYNQSKGLNGTEINNPFQIFQTTCVTLDSENAKLVTFKNTFLGKINYPIYKPEKEKLDPAKFSEDYQNNFLGEEIHGIPLSFESSTRKIFDNYGKVKGIRKRSRSKATESRNSVSFSKRLTRVKTFDKSDKILTN